MAQQEEGRQARTVRAPQAVRLNRRVVKAALPVLLFVSLFAASATASAQLLRLLAPLPILARLSPITELVGIEIVAADAATAAGGLSAPVVLANDDQLGLSAMDEASLMAMDATPRSRRATVPSQQLVAAPGGVLAQGGDQVGLYPLQTVEPDFPTVRTQQSSDCPDEDEDGVCDRDDQCRRTPTGYPVLENGCYLTAPTPNKRVTTAHIEGAMYFNAGSAELDAAGERTVQAWARALAQHTRRVTILGYADGSGESAANQRLSLRRAMTVRRLLLAAGLPQQRIAGVRGRGAAQRDGTASLRERRVELWLSPR